ncbi:hypothetical protein [Deinococcus budaensis]|uniref:Uncharacterized protein n=1 Tax=Deinococcus budaensis TaxID=1665626 RepID=A0A7W8GGP0_9DEIO|nr:hypothetical protein [Deinococcus budaensis]MBB5235317.1 hypothetical protein [Deinococcus budaensis]
MSPLTLLRPAVSPLTLQLGVALAALVLLAPFLGVLPPDARPAAAGWVSAAVLFDLTVSALGLGWITQRRRGFGPEQATLTLMLGLSLAGAVLPGWRGPLWVGAGLLGVGVWGHSRRPNVTGPHATPLERRTDSLARFLPHPVAASLAHDSLLWPGLWRRDAQVPPGAEVFTTHQRAGREVYVWLYLASELPLHLGLHAALGQKGDGGWAWLFTAADGLFTLWLLALSRSFGRFPLAVSGEHLRLSQGLLWSASVPLRLVEGAAPGRDAQAMRLTLVTPPNVTLTLRGDVTLRGPFGLTRRGRRFSLFVDDPAGLARRLNG